MMASTRGTVISIETGGFRIRGASGHERFVRTMLPGDQLKLAIGDEVSVLGGPGGGDIWLSSSCSKILPNGEWLTVRINPSDPEPKAPPAPSVGFFTRILKLFRR